MRHRYRWLVARVMICSLLGHHFGSRYQLGTFRYVECGRCHALDFNGGGL